jgi:hypothetical protein
MFFNDWIAQKGVEKNLPKEMWTLCSLEMVMMVVLKQLWENWNKLSKKACEGS